MAQGQLSLGAENVLIAEMKSNERSGTCQNMIVGRDLSPRLGNLEAKCATIGITLVGKSCPMYPRVALSHHNHVARQSGAPNSR